MILTEYYRTRSDGVVLNRTYSDRNVYIRKVGTDEIYSEAVDPENSGREYAETDILITETDGGDTENANE